VQVLLQVRALADNDRNWRSMQLPGDFIIDAGNIQRAVSCNKRVDAV
jgi:hypothetical protein